MYLPRRQSVHFTKSTKTSLSFVDPRGLNMNKLHVGIKNGDNRPRNKKNGNDQGICQIFEMKFPDLSLRMSSFLCV